MVQYQTVPFWSPTELKYQFLFSFKGLHVVGNKSWTKREFEKFQFGYFEIKLEKMKLKAGQLEMQIQVGKLLFNLKGSNEFGKKRDFSKFKTFPTLRTFKLRELSNLSKIFQFQKKFPISNETVQPSFNFADSNISNFSFFQLQVSPFEL